MKTCVKFLCGISLLLGAQAVNAETTIEYGITAAGQSMSKDSEKVTMQGLGSIDFTMDVDIIGGKLHIFVEGASDMEGTVPALIEGANYDVGTAIDDMGKGRAQLSEFSYEMDFIGYSVEIGLRDLFSFIDKNSTSNDETTQFMADPLVNNTTIAMPDYTVSALVNYGYKDRTNMTFMVANAYGLSDNDTADYADLVDFGETPSGMNKGVFALGELRMVDQDVWLSVGTWVNTREVNPLKGSYLILDNASNEGYAWSLRVGQNDDAVGVKSYGSFSYSVAFGEDALGLGASVQKPGVVSATIDNITTFETYYRWQITDWLSLTPDVQYWKNANGLLDTDTTTGQIGGSVLVYGLRMQMGSSSTF